MPPKKGKRSQYRSPPAKRKRVDTTDELEEQELNESEDDDAIELCDCVNGRLKSNLVDKSFLLELLVSNNVGKRYKGVEIFVDTVTDLVRRVLFIRGNECKEFNVKIYTEAFKPEDLFQRKNRLDAINVKMAVMKRVIHGLSEKMSFRKNKECFCPEVEGDVSTVTGDINKSAGKAGPPAEKSGPSGDKSGLSGEEPGPSGDRSSSSRVKSSSSGEQPGPSADKHTCTSPGDKQELSCKSGDSCVMKRSASEEINNILLLMVVDNFMGKVVKGFCNKTRNSVGRETLCMIMKYASKVALGCSYSDAFVYQVGTAAFPKEGFPLREIPRDYVLRCRPKEFSPPSSNAGSVAGSAAGSVGGSVAGSATDYIMKKFMGSSSHAGGGGYIYPDALLVDGSKSAFPQIVVVGEVKSDDSLQYGEHVGQIMREMLGAIVDQNQVFGLLLCSTEAQLLKMEFNGDRISLETKEYSFNSDTNFHGDQLLHLFDDLVTVVTYGHKNLKHKNIWC